MWIVYVLCFVYFNLFLLYYVIFRQTLYCVNYYWFIELVIGVFVAYELFEIHYYYLIININ